MSSTPLKRYRTKRAASRVAARLARALPQAKFSVADDRVIEIEVYVATLTPDECEMIAPHRVMMPPPPSPDKPLFEPNPSCRIQNRSTVANPREVGYAVLSDLYERGELGDRKSAVKAMTDKGINAHTAASYYIRFRQEKKIPGSIRFVRQTARRRSKVELTAHGIPTAARRVRNGYAEPPEGSYQREVWDAADRLQRREKRPPMCGEVRLMVPDASYETIKKAYRAWRLYHGIPPQPQFHGKRKLS